uniref:HD-ZIP protein N-terminal domain-containing protein n=1 Tax=Paspalum vaginatum TaxID=158149 RepID=A0A140GYL6_9POAL|nr:hypothetical protein [Paspalum vaginatum]
MMVNATDQERRYGDSHLGLGLSLSLSIATAPAPPISSVPPVCSLPAPPLPQPQWWNGAAGLFFSPSADAGMGPSLERKPAAPAPAPVAACHGMMPFLRGIDVNRAPPGESRLRASCSEDEEPGASSSPNSTLSSLSGKRGAPARSSGEVGPHTPREAGGGGSDDEDSGAGSGGGSRKKLRLSKDQAAVLEESFNEHNTLNPVRTNNHAPLPYSPSWVSQFQKFQHPINN